MKQNKNIMKNISINDTCIKCGKCVKVCPSFILSQNKNKEIEVNNVENCIVCGHCVSACPTSSVIHSEFPENKVHKINSVLLPTPEQFMLLCKSRRSNRAFTKEQVPEELLNQILEAAHRAPTASNLQQVEFTLVTNPEVLKQIADITIDVFSSLAKRLSIIKPLLKGIAPDVYKMLPQFKKLKEEHEIGNDPILRKATSIIFIHTPKESRFGVEDSNLAYQNGSLMAESLGVSQFYTGFVYTAIKMDKKKRIKKLLGINGKIYAGMALGMPSFKFSNYIDKKDIIVTKIF